MVDTFLTQVIVKRLNRWYRSRSQPHGTIDLSNRGTRLTYNNTYRLGTCLMSLLLLGPGCALYFVPGLFADKSPEFVLVIKIGWIGVLAVVFLAPLEAFREYLVVNEEGLLKSNLFGKQTRLEWREISRIHTDDKEIIFFTDTGTKLKASLCYNGWQDFVEISAKHLNELPQLQLATAVAKLGSSKSILAEPLNRG